MHAMGTAPNVDDARDRLLAQYDALVRELLEQILILRAERDEARRVIDVKLQRPSRPRLVSNG